MKEEERIDSLLSGPGIFRDEQDGAHLDDETLAARLDGGGSFTPVEQAHLAGCIECRALVGELVRRDPIGIRSLLSRRPVLAGLALAAGAALLVLMVRFPAEDPYRGVKGRAEELTAEVSLLATTPEGVRRDLLDGARVSTAERLGFRYGNPGARHRTLTVVGWDGRRLHWYYPEGPDRPAHPLSLKDQAVGVRLPFDVELSDHAPGRLLVIAAFDADPAKLASRIERGDLPRGEDVFVLELDVEAPK